MRDIKIERASNLRIKAIDEDGGAIEKQSVEVQLLLAILEKLEEIKQSLLDIDNNTYNR